MESAVPPKKLPTPSRTRLQSGRNPVTRSDPANKKERARPVSGKDGRAPGMEGERLDTFCTQYNRFHGSLQ